MTAVLFDTNIIIDVLAGRAEAREELIAYADAAISIITWIEVMTGTPADLRGQVKQFLSDSALTIIQLRDDIPAETANIRYTALHEIPKRRLKLPDAIIQATAKLTGRLLITRNITDFRGPGLRVPYEVDAIGNVTNILPPIQQKSI
ncbi:PIN domain-containing protein [Pseudoduganella sp. LjRoot289]|uniref:PIN domain-containing protein n=1 Tax=Pseudoduganella sp. LjRoot289 TaxID=3342314 RepID=UPI003ECE528A